MPVKKIIIPQHFHCPGSIIGGIIGIDIDMAIECAAGDVRCAALKDDLFQAGAAIECVIANTRHTCRNRYAGKRAAVQKCSVGDAFQTVRKRDTR